MKVYIDYRDSVDRVVSVVADQGDCHVQISHMPSNIIRFTVSDGDQNIQVGDVIVGTDDWMYVYRTYGGA